VGLPVARINRGPLFFERAPEPDLLVRVLRALRKRWRFGLRGVLLIAPALPLETGSTAALRDAGFIRRRPEGWRSSLVDLLRPLDLIQKSLEPKWRNRLRVAQKAGATVAVRSDIAAFEWMLDRHAENMRTRDFAGPAPATVRAMMASSPGDFHVLQAMVGSEPVAGMLLARFGERCEYFIGWCGVTGRRVNAHNLLMWEAIVELQRLGCRTLDLGGYSTTQKYGHFKRGLNGHEYRLCGEWLAF
jgi:hypothetical protein